jgi:hypothetical protein
LEAELGECLLVWCQLPQLRDLRKESVSRKLDNSRTRLCDILSQDAKNAIHGIFTSNYQAIGNSLPLSNEVKEVKAKGLDVP